MITQCRLITRVLAVVFLFISVSSGYGQLEDCKCMPVMRPGDPWDIVDTALWDTCGTNLPGNDCREVVLQIYGDDFKNRIYGRGPWVMLFKDSTFLVPLAPSDTILYIDWKEISPRYSVLKKALSELEQRFGSIQLRKIMPQSDTGRLSQLYELRFQIIGTVHAVTADSALAALPDIIYASMSFGPYFLESVPRIDNPLAKLKIEIAVDGHSIILYPPLNFKSRSASIVSALGEVLLKFPIDPVSPTYINISHFSRGVYFVSSETALGKFVITR